MSNLQQQQVRLTTSSATCRKVFIQRDYTEGIGVKFDTKLPVELQGRLDPVQFEETIGRINSIYADAERLSVSSCMENCLACLTGYLLLLCISTHYEKNVKRASEYIANENERVFVPRGLLMVDPMERGLRCIEICMMHEPAITSAQPTTTNRVI